MKSLDTPKEKMNIDSRAYHEITKVINYMRSIASPGAIDQINIIISKGCPITRTMLTKIIVYCWEHQCFPNKWKNHVIDLAYKSDLTSDPGNFRPFTLQPVMSKIFTVIIQNRMYEYLLQNNFMDDSTQNDFWSSISGTIKHTELLIYLLNNAKKKQRGSFVTLLNLQNKYGVVNHNFLSSFLKFHHLPDEIIYLINNLYSGYQISIVMNNFINPPITI